ncbi:undecaprenyl-diphosphatase UppP [Candidatus Woesebacteria bacterium RIFOXYC1_FULL_31_51]|nr:MAG: undecaprenol kinase, undecaprenyl-diphosphatase [Candidatus Woesebacteria bacterium GW2011_GWF1_31_35]OGM72252.1 MAG: undecaprenyl-diphosphatase UppP [Candidatus Woesebacteria bacterium RIFOXYA1_FULL_31_71]OGM77871.1 MAG: undecaprenyl-diphosphatase UppP [Candidatus Woesebacteria bacterium RIFOXYB1_FULL_31_120]OGM82786.1 MAG: undecaprenyl-diphosphatase UppP [Candidatus Woesebacteria bacterium RIFOXYC1_FULL_31_51]OGM85794.1 MAG: undecaprenyl-diphosphatase UppP [Candidatus Woesebacteria ba
MNLIQTLILSIVEGITEFLPISSTGHLILFSNLLKITQTEFIKSFEIIIQLGAILAVVVIYFKKLIINFNFDLWKKIIIAFIPSIVFGLVFYKLIKGYLIGNSIVVILSLLTGGVIMILFERFYEQKNQKFYKPKDKVLTNRDYLVIGFFQVFSMIPGVSRAFTTIFGGMLLGMKRKDATEFSFFLAIPTMFAASTLDLLKTDLSIWTNTNYLVLGIGFMGSFITAYLTIKFLIKFVQNHNFVNFGIYRIIISIIFAILVLKV